jgi:uncharacterized coiled-coil protein SlyX
MSVEFSNAYQEILLDNFNSVIKQNIMFQTQLKLAEETQKNNNNDSKINEISLKHEEKVSLLIAEYNSLKTETDAAYNSLKAENDAAYNALKTENDAVKQKIADLEPRANVGQSLHDEKSRIQSALNEELKKNVIVREEVNQKNSAIEELNKKIAEQSSVIEELNRKIAEQSATIEMQSKKIVDCENELVTKSKQIEESKSILVKKESIMPKVKKTNSKPDMNNIADGSSF